MSDPTVSDAVPVTPPRPKKVPFERVHHGHVFIDEYDWMRDKEDPELIEYLTAQNAYVEDQTASLTPLREDVFNEIRSRTKETDMSVPVRVGRFWYFTRTVEGQQYGVRCRVPLRGDDDWTPPEVADGQTLDGEQVYFDANAESKGHEFFSIGALSVSHDGDWLAYSTDVVGDERYTLRIRNLVTGEELPDVVEDTAGGALWSKDARHLFYLTVDDAWRPDTVWRHDLGSTGDDTQVYHEPDQRYAVGMGSTHSEDYLVIGVGSKITSEIFVLSADDPTGEFRSVAGRVEGVEYDVEHARIDGEDYFLLTHNAERDGTASIDFAVDAVRLHPDRPHDYSDRFEMIAHRPTRRIEGVDAFRDYLVLSYRSGAMPRLAIADLRGRVTIPVIDDFVEVAFEQELCTVGLGGNPEWDTPRLRIGYTSYVDPVEVIDLDVATGERTLLKRQPVLGEYDAGDYVATREWVTAADGTQIPVSLVRRKTTAGPAPTLLYAYGSYETSLDPGFSIARLSMLDRGMVVAFAHVRGGGEMGRRWYEDGKTLAKKNTFTDFVDVARHLIDTGWTTPKQLVAEGGSAGGLLMGAVANMAPELFGGILAAVPFVDALTSILDPSLPLTVIEWDEWGDPLHDPAVYEYMRGYSPYENVDHKPYPAILALNSLNDTRVLFTEAAKWVARLQDSTTSDNPILLKTEMGAGHGGVTGRYKQWEEEAFELAWILRQTGAVSAE
ncbi:MAG: S9 family peptidase [Gordonia sp. (in: high G+C Gram-positive bacteria)]